jgi:hypothetical protein
MRRRLSVSLVVVVLAACGCTDIGCLSAVQISLASLVAWTGTESFSVELCVCDHCEAQIIDPPRAELLRTNNHDQISFDQIPNEVDAGTVTVSVTTEDDDTFRTESGDIAFDSDRPNGPRCEPLCHFASVAVRDGRLINQET